jgi:hypothetical protein
MSTSYVFDMDSGTWTRFNGLDIVQAQIQSAGSVLENYNIFLDSDSNFKKYPGSSFTTEDAILDTKEEFINNGRLRRVKINFEGSCTLITNVRSEYASLGVYTDTTTPSKNIWQWVDNAKSRGHAFWLRIKNAEVIKSIFIEYKVN